MCFPRKPGLGRYLGNRTQWTLAYRAARIAEKRGTAPDPATFGLPWKARLVVAFDRHDHCDRLHSPVLTRLASWRLIREIIEEEAV